MPFADATRHASFGLSGLASDPRPVRGRLIQIEGARFHVSEIVLNEDLDYTHGFDAHMLYATFSGRTAASRGRLEAGAWTEAADAPGAVSFTPSDRLRSSQLRRGETPARLTFAHVEVEPDFLLEACQLRADALDWLAPFNAKAPKVFAVLQALKALSEDPTATRLDRETAMIILMRIVGRHFGQTTSRPDDAWLPPSAVRRLTRIVRDAPADDWSLAALAAETGLSVSALVRAFRGTTGMTPGAFVLRLRVNEAVALLQRTPLGVSQVAELCGFASASHLNALTRRFWNATPGALRSKRDTASE